MKLSGINPFRNNAQANHPKGFEKRQDAGMIPSTTIGKDLGRGRRVDPDSCIQMLWKAECLTTCWQHFFFARMVLRFSDRNAPVENLHNFTSLICTTTTASTPSAHLRVC